jgi:alcohol dehydrogenase (cytochrome c)
MDHAIVVAGASTKISFRSWRLWLQVVCLSALASACSSPERYPVTEQSRPLTAVNARETGVAPPVASRVTGERLTAARAEPQNWLTYYGAYDAQRYSALDQINAQNVRDLKPAWMFQAGVIGLVATPATYALEAAPIVVDGVMYLSGWDGYVWAFDAATGREYWRYRHAVPLDVPLCCGNVNRGVAVAQGKVFYAAPNGYLVALDAVSGKRVWVKAFVDTRAGESATAAPLVVKDLVIVGSSGAEYGVRGHIDAFDVETGERRWRRYNVPKPGEPGSETWTGGDGWARGGATAWVTGAYDPELDLLFWGTANPGPVFDGDSRPGKNLYTNCVLAIDPDDGSLKWHYQWTPHDVWDYDGVNENILFERDGGKYLAHFDKNGYLFILDRTTGKLVLTQPFARTTWGDINAQGDVTVKLTPTKEGVEICPGPAGAKEWVHASFSPRTGFLYAPIIEQCATFKTRRDEFREGMAYWGGGAAPKKEEQWGHVKAFDPATGREVWSWRHAHPIVASVLSTAGDLIFAGTGTGELVALHARSGEQLWQFQTGSGIHSNPISYSVNGKQFVAVASGWGGWIEGFAPELYGGTRGSALLVFALP